jgi:LacI family transcriptional regulator
LSTIRDVARLAGVSVATVSAVLNSKGTVSEKLIKRVTSAAKALDYHPDHVARSLKVRNTHTVGVVVPDITNPFFPEVIQGAENEARGNGYSVILCNTNEDGVLEKHYLRSLFSRRVDGAMLCSTLPYAGEHLLRERFPVVLVDRTIPGFVGGMVTTDNRRAAYEATNHLIGLGHTRIAIITGRLDLSVGSERVEGFRKAMQECHLPIRDEYFRCGDFLLESGYRCGMELLKLAEPPTAVFSCNSSMTLGLMRALSELRVRCPGQVSVVGFDDFVWNQAFSPRLTTVAQPSFELGRRAMQMLIRKIQVAQGHPEQEVESNLVVLRAELRIRESTDRAPSSSPTL